MRIEVDFDVIVCRHCGVNYGMPPTLRTDNGSTRFCPNGHTPMSGVTLLERIRRADDQVREQSLRIGVLERSVASYRAAATRAKKARA